MRVFWFTEIVNYLHQFGLSSRHLALHSNSKISSYHSYSQTSLLAYNKSENSLQGSLSHSQVSQNANITHIQPPKAKVSISTLTWMRRKFVIHLNTIQINSTLEHNADSSSARLPLNSTSLSNTKRKNLTAPRATPNSLPYIHSPNYINLLTGLYSSNYQNSSMTSRKTITANCVRSPCMMSPT